MSKVYREFGAKIHVMQIRLWKLTLHLIYATEINGLVLVNAKWTSTFAKYAQLQF